MITVLLLALGTAFAGHLAGLSGLIGALIRKVWGWRKAISFIR